MRHSRFFHRHRVVVAVLGDHVAVGHDDDAAASRRGVGAGRRVGVAGWVRRARRAVRHGTLVAMMLEGRNPEPDDMEF